MSFSQLARIGYLVKKPKSTPKTSKANKTRSIVQDMTDRILTERIITVQELTDESFID